MKRYLIYLVLIAVIALLSVGLYGLMGFSGNDRPEAPQNPSTDQEGIEENFQTLPDEFPEDFPIYPNSQIKDSWRAQEEAILGMSVVWTTSNSISDINSFFKQELSNSGWQYEEISNTEESFTMTIEKEETMGFVGVTEEEGQRVISVTLGIEE